jgi:glycosyltransferase involved in cell wall biosynthesis
MRSAFASRPSVAAADGGAPAASVVVCTHNRASLLPALVAAVRAQEVNGGFEVLVVDSASTDETATVAAGLAGAGVPPVRAVRAAGRGLCVARNHGLTTTVGAIVVFIDDDAVPRPGWLAALVAPFDDPLVGCVGGPVSLRFSGDVPPWLVPRLRAFLTAYDLGPTPRAVSYSAGMEDYPRGANFAVRREAARAAGGFRRLFERRGARLRSNDELDLCYRLERCGWGLRYAADARVDHLVMPERLHPTWFLRRLGAQGESDALFLLANRGLRAALGRLRWCHATHLGRTPYAPGDDPDPVRLLAECERRAAWGFVRGLLGGLPALRARGRGVG